MKRKEFESPNLKFKSILGYAIWGLVLIFSISTVRNINRVISIKNQVEVERQKVERMQAENAKIQAQINEAQGSDFIEKQIRDKLGLSKSGESIVVLPDEEIVKGFAPPKTNGEEFLPDPNWLKWKKLFF